MSVDSDGIRISLIIPAYNEEVLIPLLLDTVDVARKSYSYGAESIEVVVANNGSTDRTQEIASSRGCKVVPVSKRSIAAARNGGAQAAAGRLLAFVDADTLIHAETFNAIERALADDRVMAGATGVRPSRMSPAIAVLVAISLPFRIAGLDSGVVFCSKADWQEVGGFNEELLISEDIDFQFALKRLARKRGKHLGRARGAQAITSTRKFDRQGDWRLIGHMFAIPFLKAFRPRAFDRLVQKHWYEDRD
ncbi:MAG: glycosyltransferase [Armatimonadetes bacterium]|nr:glycosyltransferase [Armatimonadota bacterium]